MSVSKKTSKKIRNYETEEDVERPTHKKIYISSEERKQIIEQLRLAPKKDVNFQKIIAELMLTLKRYIFLQERQKIIDKLRQV